MDDAGPQSLFVVVDYDYSDKAPYFCSILQLDMQEDNQGNKHENEVIETKFTINLCLPQPQPEPQPILWSFSPLAISTEDLYMVPDILPELVGKPYELPVPLHGCIYNLRNNKFKKINPPQAPKYSGHVVSMGGHLYFMAYPRKKYLSSPIFERYDPLSDCWEAIQPFPYRHGVVLATVVLDDTILFNLGHYFCAYNAPNNKWYPVTVENSIAYCITGQAVVLGNTVYALEDDCFDLVLVFSVGRKGIKDDLEFRFSLVSEIIVSGMKETEDEDEDVHWHSNLRHLAYLGNDNFCIVQSSELSCPKKYQSIQVINMKLEGENAMSVKNARFYKLKIEGKLPFRVRQCFSLGNCTTTAVEEGKPCVLEFDPFPKHTGMKREQEDSTDHADTTLEVLKHEATLLHTPPTPAYPAYSRAPAIPSPPPYYQHPDPHYPEAPAVPSPPPYYQHPAYHYPQAPAVPSPPPYYQHPDPHYPEAPAVPSPPPYYQHPAYHYPQAPAVPSQHPYYQHPRPQPPNTPQPWPFNPQQPQLLTPTAHTSNNQPYQDYCQLCGLEGHFATNCPTYTYYNNLPRPPLVNYYS